MEKSPEVEKVKAVFETRGDAVKELSLALIQGHETLRLVESMKTQEACDAFEVAASHFAGAAHSLEALLRLERDL